MAERVFHSLKNRHLYSQTLSSKSDVTRSVRFYLGEHNNVIPMWGLEGRTPTEAYAGLDAKEVAAKMAENTSKGRKERLSQNRLRVCRPCRTDPSDTRAAGQEGHSESA